ncbi:MAG: sulfatase-like hydrolase/transferase, partial [Sphingomonadales bacterium]
DAAIADVIMARAAASGPMLIHAVTIENHGPWPADESGSGGRVSRAYLDLVARGDAMLTRLLAELAQLRRPCLLLFYGDHRPSIPGAVLPGGDRHTPFVLVKLAGDGTPMARPGPALDLTPADLNQVLQAAITA